MRDRRRYRRADVRAQQRAGQYLDQGACEHVDPGDLPCSACFINGGGER